MFIQVQLPDELYQKYAEKSPERPARLMAEQLKLFVDEVPGEARILIKGQDLKELGALLEWPIDSPQTLLQRVRKLKQVGVPKLGLNIDLSESQLLALKSQADFWNREGKASPEELVKFCRTQLEAGLAKILGVKA